MGKKVKVVFDTNVWVSIFMEEVLFARFSKAKQRVTVYVSRDIMLELSRVLLYPKIFRILEENGIGVKDVLRVIAAESKMVEAKVQVNVVSEDFADNKILECAVEAGADIIVSGDKHLLSLRKFRKSRILTPREFFDSLS